MRSLDELARRWNVSKSEALRRAVRASASAAEAERVPERVAALDRLQVGLVAADAARWAGAARAERKAASRRREERSR